MVWAHGYREPGDSGGLDLIGVDSHLVRLSDRAVLDLDSGKDHQSRAEMIYRGENRKPGYLLNCNTSISNRIRAAMIMCGM